MYRFSVDRSGLFNDASEKASAAEVSSPSTATKEKMTDLGAELVKYLKIRGPISISEYMLQALNHMTHGYYQSNSDKIGDSGDFITSPEISQIFGECVAVWCISTWRVLGSPKSFNMIELGPGNGTLMSDILRVAANFPEFESALEIHMVERSESLRKVQAKKLNCVEEKLNDKSLQSALLGPSKRPIRWSASINDIDATKPMLIVAQEFLDAFPVFQYVKTDAGWREKLVDVDADSSSPLNFRVVLAPNATPGLKLFENDVFKSILTSFEKAPTDGDTDKALSSYVPKDDPSTVSEHIEKMMRGAEPNFANTESEWMVPSSHSSDVDRNQLEVCPGAIGVVESISRKLSQSPGGAALFIDYGENYSQGDTLRGFRKHTQQHFLSEPGKVQQLAS